MLAEERRRRYQPDEMTGSCTWCQQPLPAGGQFCPDCGEPTGDTAATSWTGQSSAWMEAAVWSRRQDGWPRTTVRRVAAVPRRLLWRAGRRTGVVVALLVVGTLLLATAAYGDRALDRVGTLWSTSSAPPQPSGSILPAARGTDAAAHDQALAFVDDKLTNLLLPRGAVPVGLTHAEEYLLPNEAVARFFPDPPAAVQRMETAGRVQGAVAHYGLKAGPRRAAEPAVAVSASVAWYRTVAGAQAVLVDPTLVFVVHRLGLDAAEITAPTLSEASRTFRGYRDGDGPELAAYLTLVRRENVIGAVLVVVPAATDDGGALALSLARRQASIPLTAAVGR